MTEIKILFLTVVSTREMWRREVCSIHINDSEYTGASVFLEHYLLTPWSRALLEKLNGSAASQEIPRTVFKSARHLSLSWANSIQSQPPPTSQTSILILSSRLPNGLFPSGFPTRTLCTPLPSPIRATCPAHLILLDFTTHTILGKE